MTSLLTTGPWTIKMVLIDVNVTLLQQVLCLHVVTIKFVLLVVHDNPQLP